MGKRVHASLNARRAADLWAGVRETRLILADSEFMEQLRQGIRDMAEGRLVEWESAETDLEKRSRLLQ